MKALEAIWFTHQQYTMGIVAAKNDIGQVKFYIGFAFGNDEKDDIKNILDYGAKLDPGEIKNFFDRNLEKSTYKKD